MRFLNTTLAFGAALLCPILQAQPPSVEISIDHIDRFVVAGERAGLSFSLTNHTSEAIDKVVAVPTSPSGFPMTARNLHTRDVEAGQSLSRGTLHGVPDGSAPGTYRVAVRALSADGTVLGETDTSFDVLNFTEALEANGLRLDISEMPAQFSAGDPFHARIQFTNGSGRPIMGVYAVVQDPSGRLLNLRTINQRLVEPGGSFDRNYRERIPDATRTGTYRVQFQAMCDDGSLIATVPASFEVVAPAAGLRVTEEPLAAFPNPAADRTTLRFGLTDGTEASLTVYDALGRAVSTPLQGFALAGRTDAELDVSGYAPGLYVARLAVADGSTQTTRFTVAR